MNNEIQYYEHMPYVFPIIFVLVIFLMFCIYLSNSIIPFMIKRRYILMEINRTKGEEHRFWKRKLKRNYIRLIPVFGRVILKYSR